MIYYPVELGVVIEVKQHNSILQILQICSE